MSPRPTLLFRPDRTFAIVQLTDIHWQDGEADDCRSLDLIERVLDAERPDLVALTGDIVDGSASGDPAEALRRVAAPIIARGIPWAMVFGNHDDEGALTRLDLLAVQQDLSHCLTERGPEELTGVGNYVVRIASAETDALAAALFFLDSGGYAAGTGCGECAWIAPDQIVWQRGQARALAREWAASPSRAARLPSLAFFHLPLPEFRDVWEREPCRGHKQEDVCCPASNSGFFAALVEAGVMGAFVGHDHVNDFEGQLSGVRLCYGRAGGYSSYGLDEFPRGARVIRMREGEMYFETWVRLEDGSAATAPPLHLPRTGLGGDER
jgi:hypothetical protein